MTTSRGRDDDRPPGRDMFGGTDPEVHAAMHEAMLAELTEEDEDAIASVSARLGLAAGESEEALTTSYGAEAVRLAKLPRPPRESPGSPAEGEEESDRRRLTIEEYQALTPGERTLAIVEGRWPQQVEDRFTWDLGDMRPAPRRVGELSYAIRGDELPDSEHEEMLARIDPEVDQGWRAFVAAMAVEAGIMTPERADVAFNLQGHPLPELKEHEKLRR